MTDSPDLWGWWVDEAGDVWQATDGEGIRRFSFDGFSSRGVPSWKFQTPEVIQMPQPFNRVNRVEYHPNTDTLYLSGYTPEHPYESNQWKEAGKVVARYNDWSKGNRAAAWTVVVPWDTSIQPFLSNASISVAGDSLFTVEVMKANVHVYDAHTGTSIGWFGPGPEVGNVSGWVDIPFGISAIQRADGSYQIHVEEDGYAKVMVYQWSPEPE